MSRRRPIVVASSPTDREMDKVFVSAPFTKVGSSVDLFILKISDNWTKSKLKHRSNFSEVLLLQLSDVISHHPATQEHFEYYSDIAHKCQVQLDKAKFEHFWLIWTVKETISSSLEAAHNLQHFFNVRLSSLTKRPDKYKWEDLARLVLRPNEKVKSKAAHVETLLGGLRKIADAVSSTRDTEQFHLACAIEWIDSRLKKDPTRNKASKNLLSEALSSAKELPSGSLTNQTKDALQHLAVTYPKAFTEELSPGVVANLVLLVSEARTKKLKPETVIEIVKSMARESPGATLVTFVLATSIGLELTNQLIFAMSKKSLPELSWDI